MSLYGLHKVLYLVQNDLGFRERVRTDPAGALAGLPLDEGERRALLEGDVAALYHMGVHTFLMSRLPRFNAFGLSRELYRSRLRGVRD
jgi:hypothetical protein